MTKLCGNYEGPNRALPCARQLDDNGRHDGPHENFPGHPDGITWPQRIHVTPVPLTPETKARKAKTRGKYRSES